MIKFFSKIIGLTIILSEEKAEVGEVSSIIISPEDGSFLGFLIFDPLTKNPRVIPSIEIKAFTPNFILIKNYTSVTDIDDVVRIKKALEIDPKIIKSKVYTESGVYLGRVNEATLSITKLELERIYVSAPMILGFLTKDLIITLSNIIKIEKNKIYVKDGVIKAKEPKKEVQTALAID